MPPIKGALACRGSSRLFPAVGPAWVCSCSGPWREAQWRLRASCIWRTSRSRHAASWALGLLACVSGASLVVGFLTPGTAVLVGAATLLLDTAGSPAANASFEINRVAALLIFVDATALALLGPGAHSLDARLFGRREIIIPDDPRRR